MGKFDAQVKTLSKENVDDPKFSCDVQFFSYCKKSALPVLLILVDAKNDKAYWIDITREYLESLEPGQTSYTVRIPTGQVIPGDGSYIVRWEEIIKNHIERLSNSEQTKKELQEMIRNRDILLKNSEETLGKESPEFGEIHRFLDVLNTKLELELPIIKEVYFGSCWKIGFGSVKYSDSELAYALYSIPKNKNDLQIRTSKMNTVLKSGLTYRQITGNNPIKTEPKRQAYKILSEYMDKILSRKQLIMNQEILAREYIISFIDKFSSPLGLPTKDNYTHKEILDGITHSFFWAQEALNNPKLYRGKPFTLPLDLIQAQTLDSDREQINKKIDERLRNGDVPLITYYACEPYSLHQIYAYLKLLESYGINEIKRIYIPNDYTKKITGPSFIWSYQDPEQVKTNIETLFAALPEAIAFTTRDSLPGLKNKLDLFSDCDRLIVVLELKETYKDWNDAPGMTIYFLRNTKRREKKIDVYFDSDPKVPITGRPIIETSIKIGDEDYVLEGWSGQILDFIFREMPLRNFVYDCLTTKIKKYFREQ
jgi:hypothetical protein